MTEYPFPLAEDLVKRLPAPAADGLRYIDVRVGDTWDGILAVDPDGNCVGVHVRRQVEEYALPFDPSEIVDVRPACLWNRILAAVPFNLYDASVAMVFIGSPALLALSRFVWTPLAAVAAIACLFSIYFMYQSRGFPLIRPLAAMAGLAQAVLGGLLFARWVSA